jgi:hypothetical protein
MTSASSRATSSQPSAKRGLSSRRRPAHRTRNGRRGWLALGVTLLAAVALWFALGNTGQPGGTLTAEYTNYDFGQVRMNGGLLAYRFPLTVQGATVVTDLSTT